MMERGHVHQASDRATSEFERDAAVSRERWMALCFALGSSCFLIGPFPGYASLVGDAADAVTFFAGSILFTAGGALQSSLAFPHRHAHGAGRAAWWTAAIQSAGTLFFNVTTYQAMHIALTSSEYDRLVWRPDALGSACFLISGAIAYRAAPRQGWRPVRGGAGWWEPAINLLGCIFFGISAVAGYVVPAQWLGDRPCRGELEHLARRGLLPGVRPGHAAHRPHAEVAAPAASARARARGRADARGRRVA